MLVSSTEIKCVEWEKVCVLDGTAADAECIATPPRPTVAAPPGPWLAAGQPLTVRCIRGLSRSTGRTQLSIHNRRTFQCDLAFGSFFLCISLEADVTSRKRAHDPRYAESEHNAGKRHPSRRSVFVVTGRWNEARKFSLYFKWRRVKKRRRRHIAALVIPVALKSETSRLVSAFLDLSRRRSSTSGATTSFPLAATRSWPSLIRLAR